MISQWQTDIIVEAESWLGTPFHYGGIEKHKGTDCARFIIMTFKALGYIRPGHQLTQIPADWFMAAEDAARDFEKIFVSQLYALGNEIPIKKKRVTDILLMEYYGYKSHLGILMPDNNIIHARNERKVQIQSMKKFESRICAVLRCKGLPE